MAIVRTKKTKIVATIGPTSESEPVLERLIEAGLNIVRLNFAHGDTDSHAAVVERVRRVSESSGRRVAIFGDLPGPKMRIGKLDPDPVVLQEGEPFTLTTRTVVGHSRLASLSLPSLPRVVHPGDRIFLNDGFIQLDVTAVEGQDVHTSVAVGGELRSHKGVNFPGIDLGVQAFTDADHEHLRLAARLDLDGVSQSFVRTAEDLRVVREAARSLNYEPLLIAKIERSEAVERIEEILSEADGIMVARGDLGVEIPIEDVAPTQKKLIRLANRAGKPVITATQMLESMIYNSRPTRAEATDVANAIFDGTDCLMLSGETAMGHFPVDAVATMRRIAERTEPLITNPEHGPAVAIDRDELWRSKEDTASVTAHWLTTRQGACAVVVPTKDGRTPRRIARFRLPVWVFAVASSEALCRRMEFSYGIHGVVDTESRHVWLSFVRDLLAEHQISGETAVLVRTAADADEGYSSHFDIIDLEA